MLWLLDILSCCHSGSILCFATSIRDLCCQLDGCLSYRPSLSVGQYHSTVFLQNLFTTRLQCKYQNSLFLSFLPRRLGGLVLDAAVGVYDGFVVFQPIINGIGGNLVSVQASKISTMLHQSSILGIIPPHTNVFELPWRALFNGGSWSFDNPKKKNVSEINYDFFVLVAVPYAKSARILILMSIPGQVLFIFVADYIHMSSSTIGVPFIFSYLTVSLIQVSKHILLF